ncbi:histidine kinase [Sulfolobales archaeon HS-7]|nr:histidine kinase [Sulfolobales archaeon HS-7]
MAFARELMVTPNLVARPEQKLSEILPKMKELNEWIVPVVKNKRLYGTLSYKELLRRRIGDQAKVITVMTPSTTLEESDEDVKILAKFFSTKARAIPVVSKGREFTGVISREILLSKFLEKIPNRKVREFMSSPAITINAEDSVARARWVMASNDITRLPVLENGELVGIIATRDIINRLYFSSTRKRADIITEEERIMAAPVKEIMNYPVVTTKGEESLKKVISLMLERRISGMPVVEGGIIVGVISTIDGIRAIAGELQMTMPIQAKLTAELRSADKKSMIDALVERYIAKVERLTEVLNFRISFKKTRGEGFRVNASVSTRIGNFVASSEDKDPIVAVRYVMEKLEKRVTKELKLLDRKSKQQSKEEP